MPKKNPLSLDPWILTLAAGGMFVSYLTTTTIGVVQPAISADLNLDRGQDLWVLNAYMFTLALFAAPAGKLGDSLGHRATLLSGFALVAIGSVVASLAPGFGLLVLGLAIAGVGGAALMPSAIAIVSNAVTADSVGSALGKLGSLGTTVLVIGPLAAGVITDLISWRLVFAINVPILIALVTLGLLRVKAVPGQPASRDLTGTILLIAGLGATLFAVIQALTWGLTTPATLTILALGLALLAIFVWVELRTSEALLDLRLFKDRRFGVAAVVLLIAQFAVNGYILYIAVYLSEVFGWGAILVGFGMLTAYIWVPLQAGRVGRMTGRLGPRPLALAGMAMLTFGLACAAAVAGLDNYWLLVPSLVAMGLGQPYALTSLIAASSMSLKPEQRGGGEGVVSTMRWIGAALATSTMGLVINSVRISHEAMVSDTQAAIDGYQVGFALAAAVTAIGLLITFFAVKKVPHQATPVDS